MIQKAILAKLYDADGDINKQWFVFYSLTDSGTRKLKRFRMSKGINKYKIPSERYEAAKLIIDKVNRGIISGNFEVLDEEVNDSPSLLSNIDDSILLKQKTTKKGTWRCYKHMKQYLTSFLEEKQLTDITSAEFSKSLAYDFRKYMLLHPNSISPKTVNNYIGYLSSIFTELVDGEKIRRNPFSKMQKLRTSTGANTVYNKLESKAMLDYCKAHEPELFLFINFLYYTLNRPNGLKNLRVRDIDLVNERIRFDRGNAKSLRSGYVVIPQPLKQIIKKMNLKRYPPDYFVFGRWGIPYKIPRGKDYFWGKNREVLEKIGLVNTNHTLYSWKHTGAIRLYQEIKDLKRVSEQMLHADVLITAKYLRGLGVVFGNDEIKERFPALE